MALDERAQFDDFPGLGQWVRKINWIWIRFLSSTSILKLIRIPSRSIIAERCPAGSRGFQAGAAQKRIRTRRGATFAAIPIAHYRSRKMDAPHPQPPTPSGDWRQASRRDADG
jgi:hypothetical protein